MDSFSYLGPLVTASTAQPIAAAGEQQYDNNDQQDGQHDLSPSFLIAPVPARREVSNVVTNHASLPTSLTGLGAAHYPYHVRKERPADGWMADFG
jgi:hypothetical protein